jgi:fructose-bisphosphate aldolase, class II
MSLVRMDELLKVARKNKMAIGAFECWDSLNVEGIARAARDAKMPVIFQATSMEYRKSGGPELLYDIVTYFIRKYDLDAALHLDHGQNLDEVEECLKANFSSVMLDASVCAFEENVRLSGEASKMAHLANASCEAELGHVGGGDGGASSESVLTRPEEAEEFVRRTGVDCLAVSVGTVHGEYHGKPELRLDRLAKIAEVVKAPLVLHGGSGTPPELLKKAISLGIAKINICTDISKAFLAGVKYAEAHETPSLSGYFYSHAADFVAQKTREIIELFNN